MGFGFWIDLIKLQLGLGLNEFKWTGLGLIEFWMSLNVF